MLVTPASLHVDLRPQLSFRVHWSGFPEGLSWAPQSCPGPRGLVPLGAFPWRRWNPSLHFFLTFFF